MEERQRSHREACRLGPDARWGRRTALEIGADLHRIASTGLERLGESPDFLDPLARILFRWKACPAQILRERWLGEWNQEPRRLVEHAGRSTLRSTDSLGGNGADEDH